MNEPVQDHSHNNNNPSQLKTALINWAIIITIIGSCVFLWKAMTNDSTTKTSKAEPTIKETINTETTTIPIDEPLSDDPVVEKTKSEKIQDDISLDISRKELPNVNILLPFNVSVHELDNDNYSLVVYLTYTQKSSSDTMKEVLQMYSDEVLSVAKTYTGLNKLTIHWDTPETAGIGYVASANYSKNASNILALDKYIFDKSLLPY